MSLKRETVKAFKWSMLGTFLIRGGGFLVSIVLANMLSPEEFGLIGMIMVFMGISNSLINMGFSSAIIQKQEVNQTQLSTVFYINLGLSLFLFIVFFSSAGLIADFYDEPKLILITRVISVVFISGGLSQVHRSLFKKNLNYKVLTKISVISLIISSILAIGASIQGCGVWALVTQQLALSFVSVSLIWYFSKWRPSFEFNLREIKDLFDYGIKLFAASVIESIYQKIDSLIIGKVFNASNLGLYSRGISFQNIITIVSTSGFLRFRRIKLHYLEFL